MSAGVVNYQFETGSTMDTCRLVTLIESTVARRGDGTPENPHRVITQYFTTDGKLVVEIDPFEMRKREERR